MAQAPAAARFQRNLCKVDSGQAGGLVKAEALPKILEEILLEAGNLQLQSMATMPALVLQTISPVDSSIVTSWGPPATE